MINKMLPKGFKFESLETVKRQIEQSKQLAKLPVNKRRKVFLEVIINTLQTQEDKEVKKKDTNESSDSNQIKQRVPKATELEQQTRQQETNKRTSLRQKKPVNFDDYIAEEEVPVKK